MQLWKGRFKKELSKTTNDFNSSISFDSRMYKEDIEGSIAHATMLGRCGIIKEEEANDIVKGLKGILADIENGTLHIDMEAEDIHTFIEGELTKRIGDNGTTYPIDRTITAELLGFDRITNNSLDGVSDRDYCIEFASVLSIIMVHLSRFSEEIIMWCSWEFKFIELDDAFSTGSSIMPQKKNPDIAELVRGKSGRVFGDNMTLLTIMKGTALVYNKDMQEDKEAIFDALDTVKMCLTAFTPMLDTMRVIPENMRKAAAGGFINATDCADWLTKNGVPFRDAYKATGELVARCIELGTDLENLPMDEYKKVCDVFNDDVYSAISLERCTNERTVFGGPASANVKAQAKRVAEIAEKL